MRQYLCVGRITKPQGIRGEVKVQPYTDDPERFHRLKTVWLDERGERRVAVRSARLNGSDVYLALEGVDDRNAAEALRDTELYVDRESAVKLPEGRYFIADLIGLTVTDEDGNVLGKLSDVSQAGGNDVYSVVGERDFLFPAVRRAIARVDLESGVMALRREALAEIAVYDDDDED